MIELGYYVLLPDLLIILGRKEERQWAQIPQYDPYGDRNPNNGGRPPHQTPRYHYTPRPTPRATTPAPTTTTTPHPRGDKPDTCDTSYDAISVIRSELFIFKGEVISFFQEEIFSKVLFLNEH